MSTLSEILRDYQRETRDNLEDFRNKQSRLTRELDADRQRLDEYDNQINKINERHTAITSESSNVECAIKDLKSQLSAKEKELLDLRHKFQDCESQLTRIRKERKTSENSSGSKERDLAFVRQEIERLSLQETTKRVEALRDYLAHQWETIIRLNTERSQLEKSYLARQKLEEDRHNLHNIREVCEAREELQKLLRNPLTDAVKNLLVEELKKKEEELNRKYPGALNVDVANKPPEELVELYFRETDRGYYFFFPLTESLWGNGVESELNLASKLIWDIADKLNLQKSDGTFGYSKGVCYLCRPLATNRFDTLEVPMPNGATLSLYFEALPEEIQWKPESP